MDKLKSIVEYRKNEKKYTFKELNEEKIRVKKEGKEKILKLMREKGRVKNNDVESLLKASDATATNYLNELEEEGLIRQVGSTGSGVYYELSG